MTTNPNKQFELDSEIVLGFKYEAFISSVRSMALSNPSAYFELRKEVMKKVRSDAVGQLYKTFFNVLTEGKDFKGAPIGRLGSGDLIPCYPPQKVNDLAISAANDMAAWIDKAVDILLPDDFEKLASSKLHLKGKSMTIE